MATITERLTNMLAPAVEALDYELVGIEFIRAGKHSTLRVYIDHPQGISVDDCAHVSRQASAVLDVEDPINVEYNLEVSSPGMDRPLFTAAHYEQFQGEMAQVVLSVPVAGKRKFTGVIRTVVDNTVTFGVGEETLDVEVATIKKANLVPNFD
ncbi:ribosome maturation factor RimP [Aliidiomarina sedimenti]|uniref:Ribosome maturation factor RimP n=3 Tax=Idiomarinaceae TaxID=267893 RepID=A0A432WL42_9GAMM|nr:MULTISPECIES: ribosome maturation factor RimP [Aliidiomarina]RUO32169.1 ribosome maturation factor RimP [Aliidiomarina sedimenti]RUO34532.1 ribosome maturation factor RimP [Aliidiomarina soli]